MPMTNKGLNKLMEECGELVQIAAKKAAYMHTDEHPDGAGSMVERLEDEIADVMAASLFVSIIMGLDWARIQKRRDKKVEQFAVWNEDPNS